MGRALVIHLLAVATRLFLATPPERVSIPAGRFFYGAAPDDREAEADERPAGTIELGAFAIDRTEVTRAAYAACVAAGRCPNAPQLRLADLASQLPMTQVSFRDAAAYCAAVGGRLPTEREWERAARGSSDRRRFPWGDEPDCTRGNFGNFEGEGRCPANPGRPVEVGGYASGSSPEGVLDLAGNVWEWTADYYDPHLRASTRPLARGAEELGRAPRRSVRGGACCSVLAAPRLSNRVGFPEDYRDVDLGFRCAWNDPKQ